MNKQQIKKFAKENYHIGLACLAGVAAAYGLEQTGLPQHLYQYQIAKVALVREYFGNTMANLQHYIVANATRIIPDAIAFLLSSALAHDGICHLEEKIQKTRLKKRRQEELDKLEARRREILERTLKRRDF
jgi:hypothetical protein